MTMVMEARRSHRTPAVEASVPWTRIDIDRYQIAWDDEVVGYVDVVGSVFVALLGSRYDRAVEICQTLTFHQAVDALAASRR